MIELLWYIIPTKLIITSPDIFTFLFNSRFHVEHQISMSLPKPADNTRHMANKRELFPAFTKIKRSLLNSYFCEKHNYKMYL